MEQNIYSVGQINRYINHMLQQDYMLRNICIRGEVINCKYHSTGHIYFSLKDEEGRIKCVMFAGQRKGLAFRMKDGDKVIVTGKVEVYERDGQHQLYAREISLEGVGLLYERFLALKKELEEMGMFAPEYKQPIPKYNQRIGIVTSPTGAAIRDITEVGYRQNPFVEFFLYPVLVQGEYAKESIVKGIQVMDDLGFDVLIVGRGGGPYEELAVFNEEDIARAIFNCKTPVISSVGHEIDFTIADYVADARAATPTEAATMAVPNVRGMLDGIEEYRHRLTIAMDNRVIRYRNLLEQYRTHMRLLSPQNQLQEKRQYCMDLEDKLKNNMMQQLQNKRQQLAIHIERFKGLSPLSKLQQGFSYVADGQGHAITKKEQVAAGDLLTIHVTDGKIRAEVKEDE